MPIMLILETSIYTSVWTNQPLIIFILVAIGLTTQLLSQVLSDRSPVAKYFTMSNENIMQLESNLLYTFIAMILPVMCNDHKNVLHDYYELK